MKVSWLAVLSAAILIGAPFMSVAEDQRATFERVNSVAHSAFPPGISGYEMYWLDGKDHAASTNTLAKLIAAAKKQRTRWVVASDNSDALKAALLAAFESTDKSRKVRSEIVVVSPLRTDSDLIAAAKQVGVSLEFLLIPPAKEAQSNNSFKPSPLRGLGAGAMIVPSPRPLRCPA